MRRTDYDQWGSVQYTPQFTDDLQVFSDDFTAPIVLFTINADYELVSVPFPVWAQFGRVRVDLYTGP